LRGIKKLGIGCVAGIVGLVTFLVVLSVLGTALGWLISPLGNPIVTIVGFVGVTLVGGFAVLVTWQTIVRLHRLLGLKSERELFTDKLSRLLAPGETVRAVLAGGVAHDAPGWSQVMPVMGTLETGVVTLGEFLESKCGLALTDRRLLLVRERPLADPDVRDYPIGELRVTEFKLGSSGMTLTVTSDRYPPVSIGFNYALDGEHGEQRRAAETFATAIGRRA
jgi:hypothetical protein